MKTMEDLRGAVARGWCHPLNSTKIMDSDLAEAIAKEVWNLLNPPNLGCATTKELLAELTARAEVTGAIYYRTVDGTLHSEDSSFSHILLELENNG
jgi:hypothetical protein